MVQNSLHLHGTVCHRQHCWVLFSYVKAMIFFFFPPPVQQTLVEDNKIISLGSVAEQKQQGGSKADGCYVKITFISLGFRHGCRLAGGEEDELSPRGPR